MTALKLGIVGLCEAARPLVDAVLQCSDIEVVGYCAADVPEWFVRESRHIPRLENALDVINLPGIQLLLVLGKMDDLKSMIASALSSRLKVVVLPLAELDSTFAYDLSVTAIDDAAPLVPCFLHRFSSEIQQVREQLYDASLIEIECRLSSPTSTAVTGEVHSLNWQAVRQSFLNVADLVCWIWGDYQRVTTVTVGQDADKPDRVTITLGGGNCPDVVVTYRSAPSAGCTMQVQHPGGAKSFDLQSQSIDAAALRACWQGDDAESLAGGGTWPDLMRTFDLLDGSQRSIRRRRTVEVSREFASERSQFKTQMTAAGCGVLAFTMCAVLLLLLVGSSLDPRDSQQRESEALGFVLAADDFENNSAALTTESAQRTQQMANGLTASTAVILITATEDDALNQSRADAVATELAAAGFSNAESRIVVRPLAGGTFRTILVIGWILGFLPLVSYLMLQTLIVFAAPSRPPK